MPSLCSTVQCSGELLAEAVTLGGERENNSNIVCPIGIDPFLDKEMAAIKMTFPC
jgi:hypothetical protein